MPRIRTPEARQPLRALLDFKSVDDLKGLLGVIDEPQSGRKAILVDRLVQYLEKRANLERLIASLDDLARTALREAAFAADGQLDRFRFQARYGAVPPMSVDRWSWSWSARPQKQKQPLLSLFFLAHSQLPTDLQATLRTLLSPPEPFALETLAELPARVPLPGKRKPNEEPETVEPRLCLTERTARLDLEAVLRLCEAGAIKVSEKTQRPGKAGLEAVAAVLTDGDFFTAEDAAEIDFIESGDLAIRAFAWPLILLAAGLADIVRGSLQLSQEGRKALGRPAHETLRRAWQKWIRNGLLDELSRVSAIKGQQSRGALSAVGPRRKAVTEALRACPPGRWVSVDKFWQYQMIEGEPFAVANRKEKLYFGSIHYGNFLNNEPAWQTLEGRYTLAVLFEYAATLGLIDVAYTTPEDVRLEYASGWGADDLPYLSRYDGLLYFRVNALGAWCLGLTDKYEPPVLLERIALRVLPNLDIVVTEPPLRPADRLVLERVADQRSDHVWALTPARILAAAEVGYPVADLRAFLQARAEPPLPHTVEVFLDDMEKKTTQLADLGTARLIVCADPTLARMLAADRKLRGLCQLAGTTQLVFRAADETAVRRALRDLGYVLPPSS